MLTARFKPGVLSVQLQLLCRNGSIDRLETWRLVSILDHTPNHRQPRHIALVQWFYQMLQHYPYSYRTALSRTLRLPKGCPFSSLIENAKTSLIPGWLMTNDHSKKREYPWTPFLSFHIHTRASASLFENQTPPCPQVPCLMISTRTNADDMQAKVVPARDSPETYQRRASPEIPDIMSFLNSQPLKHQATVGQILPTSSMPRSSDTMPFRKDTPFRNPVRKDETSPDTALRALDNGFPCPAVADLLFAGQASGR